MPGHVCSQTHTHGWKHCQAERRRLDELEETGNESPSWELEWLKFNILKSKLMFGEQKVTTRCGGRAGPVETFTVNSDNLRTRFKLKVLGKLPRIHSAVGAFILWNTLLAVRHLSNVDWSRVDWKEESFCSILKCLYKDTMWGHRDLWLVSLCLRFLLYAINGWNPTLNCKSKARLQVSAVRLLLTPCVT